MNETIRRFHVEQISRNVETTTSINCPPVYNNSQMIARWSNSKVSRCYTCKPKRLAKEHIFYIDTQNLVNYHFDMISRPIIIATPHEHVLNIHNLPSSRIASIFESIRLFSEFWSITDYQLLINHGSWKHHEHLHIKIKTNENFIKKIRSDHFQYIKQLKLRYDLKG